MIWSSFWLSIPKTPLSNHSDTLSYGAERTGTVYLKLSDLSSLLPNQLAQQHRPAGQAIDSIHQLFLIYTLELRCEFCREQGTQRTGTEGVTLRAAGTAPSPALNGLRFDPLLLSETSSSGLFWLSRYHVRLALLFFLSNSCGTASSLVSFRSYWAKSGKCLDAFFAAAFMFMLFAAFCGFFHESIAWFDYCYPLPVSLLCFIVAFLLTSRVVAAAFSGITRIGNRARLG
jgi:hypothetical protein